MGVITAGSPTGEGVETTPAGAAAAAGAAAGGLAAGVGSAGAAALGGVAAFGGFFAFAAVGEQPEAAPWLLMAGMGLLQWSQPRVLPGKRSR